jgi:hypothetical protein
MSGITSLFNQDSKRIKQILLVLLVVFHLALFYSISNEPVRLRDSEEYIHSAENFYKYGNFYAGPHKGYDDYRLFSKRTPLYPIIIFCFKALNIHPNYIYIIQAFLGLLNIFLAMVLLRMLLPGKRAPYVFLGILILLTPSQFIYSQFIMADLWLQTLVMVVMVSVAKYLESNHKNWILLAILSATLGALIKPVFLPASFIIGLIGLYLLFKNKLYVWILAAAIPFLSWYLVSSKNQKLTGVFHYSSIGNMNLLHYNTNLYLNKAIGQAETEKLLGPLMIVPHSKTEFKQNYKAINTVCREALLSHFAGYSLYHLKGSALFFLDPGRFDLYSFFRLEQEDSAGFLHEGAAQSKLKGMLTQHPVIFAVLVLVFLVNIIKALGFIGFIWQNRQRKLVWVGAALVLYLAILTGPLGASRFALPVVLITISYAVGFYANVYNNRNFKRAANAQS